MTKLTAQESIYSDEFEGFVSFVCGADLLPMYEIKHHQAKSHAQAQKQLKQIVRCINATREAQP